MIGLTGCCTEAGRIEKVELDLPPGVELTRITDRSLSDLLAAGEIDCAIIARPPNCFLAGHPDVTRLYPDFMEMEEQFYARTRVWPIMHVIAMKKSRLAETPWIARNLVNAFTESKRRRLERLFDPAISRYPLAWLLLYSFQQGIAHRHARVEEIFPPGIDVKILN